MEITFTLAEIDNTAQIVARHINGRKHIAFDAPMGTGKTTFIKALCRCWGVNEEVNSPTFAIVNEYEGRDGTTIYHFDFYRIRTPQEALDFGYYDYIDSGNICLMEWPGCIKDILPDDTITVHIEQADDGARRIVIP